MAATEIATAYVSIVPSLQGVQGGLARELSTVGAKGGQTASTAWGRAFQTGIKAATATATAVVGAAGVGMGVALTKGLGRLNAIDTAKAKLRGLGNDGDTTAKIMQNATTAVKGTAFGLDEAATTAAGAVAAGIKPGKELESTLTTVANVAAATGRGMDDMGAVFNQVAAGGKAYTMQVKQIADAGLPIWQKLGEELGVTTDQVQKMVSAGEVDFATFERAASAAAGTVAQEMGTTLPGAVSNAWASISRFGANVWKGFEDENGAYSGVYSKLTDLVTAFTNAMGPVEDIGSRIGDFLGNKLNPILESITGLLNRFGDAGEGALGKFKPLMNALGPAAAMFGALGAGGLAPLLGNLPIVGSMLGPLPGMLGAIGGPAGIAAAGLFALSKVDPQEMAAGFQQLASKIPDIIGDIIRAVTHFAGDVVPAFVDAIVTNLPVLIQGIVGLVPVILDAAIQLFTALIDGLLQIIDPLIEAVIDLLPVLVETLAALVPQLIEGALGLFMAIVTALPIIIPQLISAVIDLLPVIIQTLIDLIPVLIDGAVELFTGIVEALPIIIPDLVVAVGGLIPEIVGALISAVPQIFEAGVELIKGLIEGIASMAGAAWEAVKGLGTGLVDGVKGLFGIKSPSTVFAQIGEYLDLGLAGGVGDGAASVAAMQAMSAQVTHVTDALQKSVMQAARAVGVQVRQITVSLTDLMRMMSGVFRSTVTSQLDQVARLFQTVLPSAVQTMVNKMRSGLTGFGSWFAGAFKNQLTTTLRAIQTAFVGLPPAVNRAWAGLRAGTGAPANYVLSTVYMSGIRTATNQIAKAVGMSMNLPSVARIGGYASGTAGPVLPGYTPGRDIYRFYNPAVGFLDLSGGEGILRPEVVDALGAGTINAWNASRGRAVDTHAFASGGIVNFLRKGSSGWGVDTGGGFLGAFLGDPAAGMRSLVSGPAAEYAGRAGGGMVGRVFGQIMVDLAKLISGAVAEKAPSGIGGGPPGAFNPIGWQAMSQIIMAAFPGARVSSAYRPGAIGATGVPSMHGVGRAIDIVPPSMEIFEWLLKNYRNSYQILYSPAGARQIYWAGQQRDSDPINKANHWDHIHWAMAQGGIVPQLFDSGGWLQPGLTLAENRTGRPEPVFTADQFDRLSGPRIENVFVQVDASTLGSVRDAEEFMGVLGRSLRHAGVSGG